MFTNKKIFILGMARSGYEVAKLLASENEIIVTDPKEQDPQHVAELEKRSVRFVLSDHPEELLDETFDCVIKNPGVRKDHPAVLKAKTLDIPVVNEVEVAYHYLPSNTTIIGVTGSNGKTTTTTMIYDVLKRANYPVRLAGNIGYPLSSIAKSVQEGDYLVIEISDHQLLDMYDFKVDIAVLTNLSEVHLDFHGSYESYKKTKQKIFQNQDKGSYAIINKEDPDVVEVAKTPAHILSFSGAGSLQADLYFKGNGIYRQSEKLLDTNSILIKGKHNYENIMCMMLVADILHIPLEIIKDYVSTFKGVEHRIEFVTEKSGRFFYNDSKATNTESTRIALSSFQSPTILLLGGLDRGHSFEPLNDSLSYVKQIICFGETKERIQKWASARGISVKKVENIQMATKEAYQNSEKGDIILLSPACASWDQFSTFEERGSAFKEAISHLGEK